MRILVLSDSHGDSYAVRLALSQQPTAVAVFFLGDGERDFEGCEPMLPPEKFFAVKGNCDFASMLPAYIVEKLGGKTIYATHGYAEMVKYGEQHLIERARDCGANIALYGHTHKATERYENGLYIFNPGSLHDGVYGVIDITGAGVLCSHIKLRW